MSSPQIIINWDEAEKLLKLSQDEIAGPQWGFYLLDSLKWLKSYPTLTLQVL